MLLGSHLYRSVKNQRTRSIIRGYYVFDTVLPSSTANMLILYCSHSNPVQSIRILVESSWPVSLGNGAVRRQVGRRARFDGEIGRSGGFRCQCNHHRPNLHLFLLRRANLYFRCFFSSFSLYVSCLLLSTDVSLYGCMQLNLHSRSSQG